MTATTIIYAALRLVGLLRAGQTASTVETTDGLNALNVLIENWSTERLNIPAISRFRQALVSGTSIYTMGSGGAFNTARPIRVDNATGLLTDTGGAAGEFVRFPLEIMSSAQFAGLLEGGVTSDVPMALYCDYAYPLASVQVWPVPSSTPTLELNYWAALASFPDLTTDVALPAGYSRPIQYALALELAPRFAGAVISPAVAAIADESKAAIRALNAANGLVTPDSPTPVNQTPEATK